MEMKHKRKSLKKYFISGEMRTTGAQWWLKYRIVNLRNDARATHNKNAEEKREEITAGKWHDNWLKQRLLFRQTDYDFLDTFYLTKSFVK